MSNSPSSGRLSALRTKLPELLVEGISVAFAVLLALFVDQWRENRSNVQLAERAEESILAEVRTNLERLEEQAMERDSLVAYTQDVRRALVAEEEMDNININFSPALLARTAWETAQVTRALHFMDYDRVARIGRIYEVQELYEEAESALVRALSGIGSLNWDEPVEAVDVILPTLVRVDRFGDMLTFVYENADQTRFGDLPDAVAPSDTTFDGSSPGSDGTPDQPQELP